MACGARRPGERRRALDGRRPRVSGHRHRTSSSPSTPRSGATLWSAETQTGVVAAPISYEVAGVQYVAVMVGTGGSWAMAGDEANAKGNNLPNISRLLVFALGGAAELPPAPPRPVRELAPPPATAAATLWRTAKPSTGRIAGDATAARARRTSASFRTCATARCSARARRGPPSSSTDSSRRTAWHRLPR